MYMDKVDVCSNCMELVEKHSFTGLEILEEFWMQIDSCLADAYVDSPKLYIIGDGARYIENQWECARSSLLRPDIRSSTEAHDSLVTRYLLLKLGNYFSNKKLTPSLLTKAVYLYVFLCYD